MTPAWAKPAAHRRCKEPVRRTRTRLGGELERERFPITDDCSIWQVPNEERENTDLVRDLTRASHPPTSMYRLPRE